VEDFGCIKDATTTTTIIVQTITFVEPSKLYNETKRCKPLFFVNSPA